MSLKAIESQEYGTRIEFPLVHFSSRGLAIACLAAGLGFAVLGMTERAAVKNVQGLAWGLGLFMIALASLTFLQRYRQKQKPYVAVLGALRYVWRPAKDGPGERFELELKDALRTLWLVDRYHRRLLVETGGRTLSLFGSWKLEETDVPRFIAMFEQRAAMCRAGVDSREELGAAEAWLSETRASRPPAGIGVERKNKRLAFWAATDEAALREALDRRMIVFVPERSHRLLSESIDSALRPLRGVD